MNKSKQQLARDAQSVLVSASNAIRSARIRRCRHEIAEVDSDTTPKRAEESIAIAKRLVGGSHVQT